MASSRILLIGGTGYIGRYIAGASIALGHPTYLLVRESTASNPQKAELLEHFKASGANIVHIGHSVMGCESWSANVVLSFWGALHRRTGQGGVSKHIHPSANQPLELLGSLDDHASLVEAIKKVDVVISTVGEAQLMDQMNIIEAIKEVGTIKRFLPSEFGNDVDRHHAVEPAKTVFGYKAKIRRAIEAEGIPYTYVSSNCFAKYCFERYFVRNMGQRDHSYPPTDKVAILGDGNVKVVFVKEEDIGTFTIKAVDDPRTLNRILYLRLPANTYSFNELVASWEKKIGKPLEKVYVPEEAVLKKIEANIDIAIGHSIFIKGDQTNFEIGPDGVEGSQLYPDVNYTTVDKFLSYLTWF